MVYTFVVYSIGEHNIGYVYLSYRNAQIALEHAIALFGNRAHHVEYLESKEN